MCYEICRGILVDHYFNFLFEEGDHVESKVFDVDDRHISWECIPPTHMTNLCLSAGQSSFEWLYNPHPPMDVDLVVGNLSKNKVECMIAINKCHMKYYVDYKVSTSDKTRYIICCINVICKFRLLASYRKISDLWEISITKPST